MHCAPAVVLLAAALAMSSSTGCSGDDCDAIGCVSGVSVDVPEGLSAAQFPVEVRCADAECTTERFAEGQLRPGATQTDPSHRYVAVSFVPSNAVGLRLNLSDGAERDVQLTLTIRPADGSAPLMEVSTETRLRAERPGGKGCEVSCYAAHVRYDPATRTLVDT